MRRLLLASLTLGSLLLAGCGSSSRLAFKGQHQQASPINLSVYIGNGRVLVSPKKVGAGPVVFNVTNQAARTQIVTVTRTDHRRAVASTGPISPRSSAQLTVDFTSGDYRIATHAGCATCLITAADRRISPARLRIGAARRPGNNELLQP